MVIPSMNEGVNIVDTIASIADCQTDKNKKIDIGTVVVINNRPDSDPEVLKSNMLTYTLLQGIRHGVKVTIRGRPDLTEKIKLIGEKGMRIEIIDAFSPEHAHPQSNVGRARKIGTELAVTLAKGPRSAVISTDADTIMGSHTIYDVNEVFAKEAVDAMPLIVGRHTEDLDERSREAFNLYRLYWDVSRAAEKAPEKIEALSRKGTPFVLEQISKATESAVWLSGGGTAFTAESYAKSAGYKEVGTAEDTLLAPTLAQAGARIKDLTDKYPDLIVYTRPRISMRTERGFGHTVAGWDVTDSSFGEKKVPHPEVSGRSEDFLISAEKIFESLQDTGTQTEEFRALCVRSGIPTEDMGALRESFATWGGIANEQSHFDLLQKVEKIFDKIMPLLSMKELIEYLELKNSEYSNGIREIVLAGEKIGEHLDERAGWRWEEFKKDMQNTIAELGIEMTDQTEVDLKLRSLIAAEYIPTYETVARYFVLFFMSTLREAANEGKLDDDPYTKELLLKFDLLDNFTHTEFFKVDLLQRLAAKINIVDGYASVLRKQLPDDTQKKLRAHAEALRTKYNELFNAKIERIEAPEQPQV